MGKGERTRNAILETAVKVFEERRFENGSINEIARRLNVRNSLIYYYFKNKEHIFKEIVQMFHDGLRDEIAGAGNNGEKTHERIAGILSAYEAYIRKNRSVYDIFREIEFVEKELAEKCYQTVTEKIGSLFPDARRSRVDIETISYAVLGSVYFVVLKNLVWDGKPDIKTEFETVKTFLEHGIDAKGDFKPYIVQEKKIEKPEERLSARGERTRYRIIRASEKLFGKKGYEKTQVSEIANDAKVGIGTFYTYFESKKQALAEVVRNVNKLLRMNSREYFMEYSDRRDIENAGIQAFFYQFKSMGMDYRIVREAEFVEREIGTWYYTSIASSYKAGLEEGMKRGEIRKMDPETLAYILMGISHTVGLKWFILDEQKQLQENSVMAVLEFVMHGVEGIERRIMDGLQRTVQNKASRH